MSLRKIVLIGFLTLIVLGGVFFYQYSKFNDGLLHVVFCDVGQGDAIYIRTPKNKDIIFDGGPDNSVLSCLSSHMPFWDRQIELMILSHPHADHLNGLISALERYSVLYFATEKLGNSTAGYEELKLKIKNQKLNIKNVYAGDKIKFNEDISLSVLAPTKLFLEKSSPGGQIGDTKELSSLILLLSYGSFDVLLTGDSQTEALQNAIDGLDSRLRGNDQIEVLQVPHHGSKTGLNNNLTYQISPKLAIISVGRKNKYGHPSKEVLKLLKDQKIKTLRTDEKGEIEIVSDGERWWLVGAVGGGDSSDWSGRN